MSQTLTKADAADVVIVRVAVPRLYLDAYHRAGMIPNPLLLRLADALDREIRAEHSAQRRLDLEVR